MKMTKRIACAAWTCLGIAVAPALSQEAGPSPFEALQLAPELMSERLRDEQGPALLWDRLVPMDHYARQAAANGNPGAWTDANVRDLLTAVDAILARWTAPVDRSRAEQAAFIQLQFSHIRFPAGPRDSLAGDPKYLQWARDHCDFIKEAGGVVVFTQLLQHLRPGSFQSPHVPGGYDPEFAARNPLPFGTEMAAISAMLDLPDASGWLPARFDVKRLRARERALRQEDERRAYEYLGHGGNTQVVMTTQCVREAWAQGPLRDSSLHASEEIALLNTRMGLLADPVKSGFCERLKIDTASLAASGGDPTRVRMADGRAPDILGLDYNSIAGAYLRGCTGKRDVAGAKRTLQLRAEGHHDHGKLARSSHCTLARWERYGVVGRRDEKAAKAWEERALRDVGQPCPADRPEDLIDPRNPMADLHL